MLTTLKNTKLLVDLLIKFAGIILMLAVFFLPSSKLSIINGYPLNPFEIILFLMLMWVFLSNSFWKDKRKTVLILSLLFLALLLQFFIGNKLSNGWSICLKRELAKAPLTTQCERTVEFKQGERSYVMPSMDFTRLGFPLFFMNYVDFGYLQSEHNRYSLPYSFEAFGFIKARTGSELNIKTTIPNTRLTINDKTEILPVGQDLNYKLTENAENQLRIEYKVNYEYENELYVQTSDPIFYKPTTDKTNLIAALYAYLRVALLIIFAFLIIQFKFKNEIPSYSTKKKAFIIALVLYTFILAVVSKSLLLPALVLGIVLSSWMYYSSHENEKRSFLPWSLISIFIMCFIFISKLHVYGQMIIWPGGADTFVYADYSRHALLATNLREFLAAGEYRLYYFQPIYRYFAAIVQQISGESYWGVYLVQSYLYALFIFFGLNLFLNKTSKLGGIIFASLIFIFSGINESTSIFNLTQFFYTQSLAVPLFLLSIISLLSILFSKEKITNNKLFLTGLLTGAALMTRTDFIPAIPFMILLVLIKLRQWDKKISLPAAFTFAGLLVAPFLVIARNFIITGKAVMMPTSTMVNILPPFRSIVPYVSGPVEGSGVKLLLKIIYHYKDNPGSLLDILLWNIEQFIVSPVSTMPRQWLFYSTFTLAILALILWKRNRSIIFSLGLSILSLIFTTSFFLMHTEYGMLAIFDYLIIIVLAIALESLIFNYLDSKNRLKKLKEFSNDENIVV